jgi:hypothetical protein
MFEGRETTMPAFICSACGTQYPSSDAPPPECPVCEDERQYIPPEGQSWTTLERLRISHHNGFRQYEPGLIGIGTQPKFAIGQRALLVCTCEGNILWDCISLIDDATITLINGVGGLRAIAISHPHFYTTLVDWSRALGMRPSICMPTMPSGSGSRPPASSFGRARDSNCSMALR